MAELSDIDLVLWLYRVILISCYGCMYWYWSHFMVEWSDIDRMLWLNEVILIACYGWMKWYWSHVMAEWSDIDLILWTWILMHLKIRCLQHSTSS